VSGFKSGIVRVLKVDTHVSSPMKPDWHLASDSRRVARRRGHCARQNPGQNSRQLVRTVPLCSISTRLWGGQYLGRQPGDGGGHWARLQTARNAGSSLPRRSQSA